MTWLCRKGRDCKGLDQDEDQVKAPGMYPKDLVILLETLVSKTWIL